MTEIKMPSAGQTTDEATIVKINIKVGDTVKRGDVLFEAETDKATLPVESFASGSVIDLLIKEGDKVNAGTVLAVIGKEGEKSNVKKEDATGSASPAPEKVVEVSAVSENVEEDSEYMPIIKGAKLPSSNKIVASNVATSKPSTAYPAMPSAKQLAKEKNIDLSYVNASNGQFIKKLDVENYVPQAVGASAVDDNAYKVMEMSKMRQVIGRRMKESLDNIPCWQGTISINMDACIEFRNVYKQKLELKLSYNDILAKAIAVASRKFPLVNARYENDEVRIYKHTNVGLAVGLDAALVVPVVKNIDIKGLAEISADYKDLVKKAREGKLAPSEMGCGSITISNLGMYDIEQFIAIDNPPESCILAVGSIVVKPYWDGEKFVPINEMKITGSFDHRIIDGAYGAQFLQELKKLLENPTLMLS